MTKLREQSFKQILIANILLILTSWSVVLKYHDDFFRVIISKIFQFLKESTMEETVEMSLNALYKVASNYSHKFFVPP